MTTGTLSQAGQHDWLAVNPIADQPYLFIVTGLTDDASVAVGAVDDLNADGQIQEQVIAFPRATAQDQTVWFNPSTSGTYYVDVSDPNTIGAYAVTATTVSADFTDNASTTGVVTVNGTDTTGDLSTAGQHDWLAVNLVANQAYLFTVTGLTDNASVAVGAADDLDADGQIQEQAFAFPGATTQDQTVWFDPSTSGTYYIDLSDPSTTGAYTVRAATVSADFTDNTTTTGVVTVAGAATTGDLTTAGQEDWLAVNLVANQAYEFTVTGLTNNASVAVGAADDLDADGQLQEQVVPFPGATAQDQTVWFDPSTSGTYYIDVSDPSAIGAYTVNAATVSADLTDNITTDGVVTVNGATTAGDLATAGQHDWLAVNLVANQAYVITVTGLTDNASVAVGAADDLDADGQLQEQVVPFPGATAQDQTVWFDPSTSGTYYIDVSDPSAIGAYTVNAATVSADLTDNITTDGVVTVNGATTAGDLATAGQHDWLAANLVANQAYVFTVTGLTNNASVAVGAADDLSADGQIQEQVTAFPGATAQDQTVWFDPSRSGTYYIDVSDPSTTGAYAVSATTVSADFTDNVTTSGIVEVMCFLGGTQIATPVRDVSVDHLAVGDLVMTLAGQARRIVWVGKGKVLATRFCRTAATPVIVRRGALADNVPNRDLHITRAHGLYINGVLIPVEFLVNHRTILWDDRAQEVEIYHIELESHDVLIANGAPAESYRDDGNRWLFQNANSGWHLAPQEPCAPVLTGGPVVDAAWRRLLDRAGPRNLPPLTDDPDLHLMMDGARLDAATKTDGIYVFNLRNTPAELRLVSRAIVPQEVGLARDPRCLGVALKRIVVRQGTRFRTFQAGDEQLTEGFHPFEPSTGLRWTDGDAILPPTMSARLSGARELVLHLGGTTQYIEGLAISRAA